MGLFGSDPEDKSFLIVSGLVAENLPNIESKGKVDPYASFEYQGK